MKETSTISFNASGLDLHDVTLHRADVKKQEAPVSQTIDTVTERAVLAFPTAVPAGSKAQLKIKFDAPLTGSMMGYYYSTWKNEGKDECYSLTQFEVCTT